MELTTWEAISVAMNIAVEDERTLRMMLYSFSFFFARRFESSAVVLTSTTLDGGSFGRNDCQYCLLSTDFLL